MAVVLVLVLVLVVVVVLLDVMEGEASLEVKRLYFYVCCHRMFFERVNQHIGGTWLRW